jgi:FkbM family methyltransferase
LRDFLIKKILKRKLFKGQFKIFLWLLKYQKLKHVKRICKPIIGNFNINVDTKNFIDACVYYTGDYEPYLKKHFKNFVKNGDYVLDVGANIGFHTLYFAELTGVNGKVFSFEPIPVNFNALQSNIKLNQFPQITAINKALGNTNSPMEIHVDQDAQNPGAFNLLDKGPKNTVIDCIKGDDFLDRNQIEKIDFIKIDVEGFEYEVFKGLSKTIKNSKPIIIFEYDYNYQHKLNDNPKIIFEFLTQFGYQFFTIDGYGNKAKCNWVEEVKESEILALPD